MRTKSMCISDSHRPDNRRRAFHPGCESGPAFNWPVPSIPLVIIQPRSTKRRRDARPRKPVVNFRLMGAVGVAAFAMRGRGLMSPSSWRSAHQETAPGFAVHSDCPANCWAEQSEHGTRDAAVSLPVSECDNSMNEIAAWGSVVKG